MGLFGHPRMNTNKGWLFDMSKVCPVLLAGGFGKRLWHLSCKSYPKQFSKLIGDKSLFQSSASRLFFSNSPDSCTSSPGYFVLE